MEQLKPSAANSSPLTPLGFLDRAATIYGDVPSIVYNHTTFTWAQTHRRCLQLASAISSLGIRRGSVVSVVAPNIPAMYELQFSIPFAGAILNNINLRLDARTISVILRHANSALVFVDCASRDLVLEALSLFPKHHTQRPLLVLIADDSVENADVSCSGDFVDTYEGLVSKGDPNFEWVRPISEWDPMILNYTSGTTSSPKGVVHSHRGIFLVSVDTLIDWAVPKRPIYLWTLPIFHANGWSLPWGIAASGGTNICVRKFDAGIIYSLIKRNHVTHMCGAPVVLSMLTNSPDNKPLERPVHILTAGAPPPATDRSKDVIISGGENLSSVEVESILYGHPAVVEAAVVARPHEYWGETPCAFLSLKAGLKEKPSEDDIIKYCREKMPHYMVPKTVVFKDELPKTSTGKIQKFLLRQIAKEMGSSMQSRM
ncbi:hypothetical protein HKW66_Vig0128500 [Vigna angularis]|uniref:AMP-dependent synthetase/ligase domain-containing protein n=1 Tax=Phaseolus angularis TaxID=3914 RepID=A0A8T0K3W1_PHAAN|nr:hypothetical protein HKW66_Vig0128500 [Vigna angularis]